MSCTLTLTAVLVDSTPTSTTQYRFFTDGSELYRRGVRDGALMLDKAITPVGFNGVEDTDWINIKITQ